MTCPPNTISGSGSIDITNCSCDRGYTEAYGSCVACVPGKYKEVVGSAECTPCVDGTYSKQGGAISNICDDCGMGFYASSDHSVCLLCPANSNSILARSQLTDCKCIQGFFGPDGGPCVPQQDAEEFLPKDVIVKMVIGLPLSVEEFTPDKQISFRQSIADAAGVSLVKVRIAKIEAVDARRRHILAENIAIDVQVATKDQR